MSDITIQQALDIGYQHLQNTHSNYKNEILWIMQKSLNQDLTFILSNKEHIIANLQYKLFLKLVNRRKNNEPLQHILNSVSFYGYDFDITKNVFIPRPETEICISILKKHVGFRNAVLEVGTGTGCISILIELEKLSNQILSIDINRDALKLAQQNAKKFNCTKTQFCYSDFFGFHPLIKYDLIISNPPYIAINEINELDSTVKLYDPLDALTDYENGLKFYKHFANIGLNMLSDDGYMLFEFGGDHQLADLKIIFNNLNYTYNVFNDFNNVPRFMLIQKVS